MSGGWTNEDRYCADVAWQLIKDCYCRDEGHGPTIADTMSVIKQERAIVLFGVTRELTQLNCWRCADGLPVFEHLGGWWHGEDMPKKRDLCGSSDIRNVLKDALK